MAAVAPKNLEYKSYTPQGWEKLTPQMLKMKKSDWLPKDFAPDFDPNGSHEAWIKLCADTGEAFASAMFNFPSPDSTFGENAPYKKTVIAPIGNELSCECTVFEPLQDAENKFLFIYIHGGGMAIFDGKGVFEWGSALYSMEGHIAAIVHFTNSVDECYPRGLNDTISAIKFLSNKYKDQVKGICLHGESGGSNLIVAAMMKLKQEEPEKDYVDCLYISCPYLYPTYGLDEKTFATPEDINGSMDEFVEEIKGNSEFISRSFFLSYKGPDKDEVEFLHDKFAWPYFASEEDFKNFPPTYIMSNECDILKDVGLRFYRQLIAAGVQSYHSEEAGTFHGSEGFENFYGQMIKQRRETFLSLVLDQKAEKAKAAEQVKEE